MMFENLWFGWPSRTGSTSRPAINLIGAKANLYLSSPGFSGQVIAAGTEFAYIATDDGNILAACRQDLQPHPRSFQTDLDLAMIRVGLRTWVEGTELRFSNDISLDLKDRRQVGIRQPPAASRVVPLQQLRSRCDELLRAALDLHEGENLGLALPFFTTDNYAANSPDLPSVASPLINAGVEQIERLIPICRYGNLEAVLQLAEQLIGLGPGLTPSGDDFTGGLIFMSLQLIAAYPEERLWEGGNIPGLLARSALTTSKLSHALLTDLAEGQSHASLHDLADALVSDVEGFDAANHVRQITRIGHTSGWDMLTGVLAGLLPVLSRVLESALHSPR